VKHSWARHKAVNNQSINIPLPIFTLFVSVHGLFAWLFIAARAFFQLSCNSHHSRWQNCKFRPMLSTNTFLLRATPAATRDPGCYGLIRRTGTYVPQCDSNPRTKDHQIFTPALLPLCHAVHSVIRTRELRIIRYLHRRSYHCAMRSASSLHDI
jgi:hypothetical protein